MEFGKDGVDQESRPFSGVPEESPDVIQTLPNVVPRHSYDNFTIQRSHCINNDPDRDTAGIPPPGIMGLYRLIRRSNCAHSKDQVRPFNWPLGESHYLTGDPDERSQEEEMYVFAEDQLTTFNALIDRMELL